MLWTASLLTLCELPVGYRLLQECLVLRAQYFLPRRVKSQVLWRGTRNCLANLSVSLFESVKRSLCYSHPALVSSLFFQWPWA